MFVLMIYVKSREEQNVMKEVCRDAVAHLSKEKMELICAERPMEFLPNTFLQCHRSFVFNREHLKNVKLSEGTVCLENGLVIPVSRGYRKEVKEFLNERRGR